MLPLHCEENLIWLSTSSSCLQPEQILDSNMSLRTHPSLLLEKQDETHQESLCFHPAVHDTQLMTLCNNAMTNCTASVWRDIHVLRTGTTEALWVSDWTLRRSPPLRRVVEQQAGSSGSLQDLHWKGLKTWRDCNTKPDLVLVAVPRQEEAGTDVSEFLCNKELYNSGVRTTPSLLQKNFLQNYSSYPGLRHLMYFINWCDFQNFNAILWKDSTEIHSNEKYHLFHAEM